MKYWFFRFVYCYAMMFFGGLLALLIGVPTIVPAVKWLFYGTPYELPDADLLIKLWKVLVLCTVWVGTVVWLSEFIPWLIEVRRQQRNSELP